MLTPPIYAGVSKMFKLLSYISVSCLLVYSSFGYCQTERYKCHVTYKKNKQMSQKIIEIDAWGLKSLRQILKSAQVYGADGLTQYPIKKVHECTKVTMSFESEVALGIENTLPR